MAQDWYVMMNNQQVGPVSPQQLRQMAQSGQLQPTDTVWKEGMANWMPASTIKGLPFGGGAIAPGPAPAAAPSGGYAPARQRQAAPVSADAGLSKNFQFDGGASDFFVVWLL